MVSLPPRPSNSSTGSLSEPVMVKTGLPPVRMSAKSEPITDSMLTRWSMVPPVLVTRPVSRLALIALPLPP